MQWYGNCTFTNFTLSRVALLTRRTVFNCLDPLSQAKSAPSAPTASPADVSAPATVPVASPANASQKPSASGTKLKPKRSYVQRLADAVQLHRMTSHSARFIGLVADADEDAEYNWLNDSVQAIVTSMDGSKDDPTHQDKLNTGFKTYMASNIAAISDVLGIDETFASSHKAYVKPLNIH